MIVVVMRQEYEFQLQPFVRNGLFHLAGIEGWIDDGGLLRFRVPEQIGEVERTSDFVLFAFQHSVKII